MLGVTGTLAAGLHDRYGWQIVAAAKNRNTFAKTCLLGRLLVHHAGRLNISEEPRKFLEIDTHGLDELIAVFHCAKIYTVFYKDGGGPVEDEFPRQTLDNET